MGADAAMQALCDGPSSASRCSAAANSLNLAVSASIVLYVIYDQREREGGEMNVQRYLKTAAMAAASFVGDSPLFLIDYLLRFLRVAVLLSLWRMILAGQGAGVGHDAGRRC